MCKGGHWEPTVCAVVHHDVALPAPLRRGSTRCPNDVNVARVPEHTASAGISLISSIYLLREESGKPYSVYAYYSVHFFLIYIRSRSQIQAPIAEVFPTAFQLYFILSYTKTGCPGLLVMPLHRIPLVL